MNEEPSATRSVRLYVDDELPREAREAFEGRLAGDTRLRQQVEFEQGLRARVSEILGRAPAAPPDLADAVRRRLAEAPEPAVPQIAAPSVPLRPNPVQAPARRAGWRQRLFEQPRRANALAVAASLLLVGAAVLFGMFGRTIDELARPGNLVAEAAVWASSEHSRCGDRIARDRKLAMIDRDVVRDDLSAHLGVPFPDVFDLGALGYRFVGAAHCKVPRHDQSAHLMYERVGGSEAGGAAPRASIFVVPNVGQFPDDLDAYRWAEADGGPQCSHRVLRSTDGTLVFFLVCCQEGDLPRLARRVQEALVAERLRTTSPPVR